MSGIVCLIFSISVDYQATLQKYVHLVDCAITEVDDFCEKNTWICEVNDFCAKWTNSELSQLQDAPAYVMEVSCYKLFGKKCMRLSSV